MNTEFYIVAIHPIAGTSEIEIARANGNAAGGSHMRNRVRRVLPGYGATWKRMAHAIRAKHEILKAIKGDEFWEGSDEYHYLRSLPCFCHRL